MVRRRYATLVGADAMMIPETRREARRMITACVEPAKTNNGPGTPGHPTRTLAGEVSRSPRLALETRDTGGNTHVACDRFLPAVAHMTVEHVRDWLASAPEPWGYRPHKACCSSVRASRGNRDPPGGAAYCGGKGQNWRRTPRRPAPGPTDRHIARTRLFRYSVIALPLDAGSPRLAQTLEQQAMWNWIVPGSTRNRVAANAMRDRSRVWRAHTRMSASRAAWTSRPSRPCSRSSVSIPNSACARSSRRSAAAAPLARTTVHRLFTSEGMMEMTETIPVRQRRFRYAWADDLWMSDVMHGPRIWDRGKREARPTRSTCSMMRCGPRSQRLRLLRDHARFPAGAATGNPAPRPNGAAPCRISGMPHTTGARLTTLPDRNSLRQSARCHGRRVCARRLRAGPSDEQVSHHR